MQYRKLGRTDLKVSAISLGLWQFGGGSYWGDRDEQDLMNTVDACFEVGMTTFDTAEGYGAGQSEEILAKAIGNRRKDAIIATKVSSDHLTRKDLLAACDNSLRRLKTDYIDLYQVHWPGRSVPVEETTGALQTLLDQGKVRAVGVSNFGSGDLADILPHMHFDSNQLPYSLLWRAIEFGIQDKCVEEGMGILCYSPLMQGLLTGRWRSADEVPSGRAVTRLYSGSRPGARHDGPGAEAETFATLERIRTVADGMGVRMGDLAMAWLLYQPGVASVIAGTGKAEQVRQNAAAAELNLTPDVLRALDEATDGLKQKMGPNPDQWEVPGRYR